MTVSFRVAKFLKNKFGYKNSQTLYIYDRGEKKFSLEPATNPIPAPTIIEAVEFLWKIGIKIYSLPEGKMSRGVIQVGNKRVKMKTLENSPSDSFLECLEFLSLDMH